MQRPPVPATPAAEPGSSSLPWLVLAAVGVVAIGGIAAAVALVGSLSGGSASGAVASSTEREFTTAEVAAVDLATTPEALAKRFGVPVRSNGVSLNLRGGRFKSVGFHWDDGHLEHVSRVVLSALDSGIPPDVVERTRAQLGRALRPAATGGFQYGGSGAVLSISSGVYASANGFEDGRWKERVKALFTVLKGAALGTSDVLDERTKRDVLNLGYPLARLTEIDFELPVESAEREMHRVFPGAVSAAERHDVGLGHPWIDNAMVLWQNSARGKFDRVNLYFAPTFDFKAQREDVARCLTPVLGAPRVNETNHLAGEVTLTFSGGPDDPRVHVSHQVVLVHPAPNGSVKASVSKVLTALAACG